VIRWFALAPLLAVLALARSARADDFTFQPPGDLVSGSGQGRVDDKVYAPGMRFPMESGPAFANSQVWGVGGSQGPAGGQCDAANFSYPWRDNYCETRTWDMPLCPAGTGHQGQDIRAATCDKEVHPVVAAEAGTVTNVGSYSVYVTTPDGTRFDYLHMGAVAVAVGQSVQKGQLLGKVSNEFGGTATTVHLHFNIRQNVSGLGNVYVPPYLSLVESYQALIGPVNKAPQGFLQAVDCSSVRGWTQDPDVPEAASKVRLVFGGAMGEPGVTAADFIADRHLDALCEALGSCEHGFETPLPLSLLDEAEHAVHAYGLDGAGGEPVALEGSPKSFSCALELPDGVRRQVTNPESFAAWAFDPFWDQASVDDATLDELPLGDDLGAAPVLVRADDGSPEVWLLDLGIKRHIESQEVAAAWSFDLGDVDERPASEIEELPEGPPVWSRPWLVKGTGDTVYLLDADLPAGGISTGDPGIHGKGTAELDSNVSCGCRVGRGAGGIGLLTGLALAAVAGLRRRRRA
jgi:murein DD-endopeptidase MepM/ murein hydrolase activator NlpD